MTFVSYSSNKGIEQVNQRYILYDHEYSHPKIAL